MKKYNLILTFVAIILIIVCGSCEKPGRQNEQIKPKMFPLWNGKSPLFRMSDSEMPVCVIQYEPMKEPDNSVVYKPLADADNHMLAISKRDEVTTFDNEGWDGLPQWRHVVKVFCNKDEIGQIIDCLYEPELPGKYIFEPTRFLAIISVSNCLYSQTTILVPYAISGDGYAVTPRGKDQKLYEILNLALQDWHAQVKADNTTSRAIGYLLQYNPGCRKNPSKEGFRAFLRAKNEYPDSIISTLENYYGDPNFLENLYREPNLPSSELNIMRGDEDPNNPHQGEFF
jgi:hypothetical protein